MAQRRRDIKEEIRKAWEVVERLAGGLGDATDALRGRTPQPTVPPSNATRRVPVAHEPTQAQRDMMREGVRRAKARARRRQGPAKGSRGR